MKKTSQKKPAAPTGLAGTTGSGISDREINELMHECFLHKELDDLGAPTESHGAKLSAFGRLRRIAPVLLADKARLDWIAKNRSVSLTERPIGVTPESLRASIDAAMGKDSPNTAVSHERSELAGPTGSASE